MKTIRTALIALLLMALLTVPGFAEPASEAAASTVPVQATEQLSGNLLNQIQPYANATEPATDLATEPATEPATTPATAGIEDIMPISAGAEDSTLLLGAEPTPLEYIEANALALAALAAAALALLCSFIALAKTKKKSARRRMKNYF